MVVITISRQATPGQTSFPIVPSVYLSAVVTVCGMLPVCGLSVVRAIPVRDLVGGAVLQHEPGREPGTRASHTALALLRLEERAHPVGDGLRRLCLRLSAVHKERTEGCRSAQHPGFRQERCYRR